MPILKICCKMKCLKVDVERHCFAFVLLTRAFTVELWVNEL